MLLYAIIIVPNIAPNNDKFYHNMLCENAYSEHNGKCLEINGGVGVGAKLLYATSCKVDFDWCLSLRYYEGFKNYDNVMITCSMMIIYYASKKTRKKCTGR